MSFINTAYADPVTTTAANSPNSPSMITPFVVMLAVIVLMYFFMWRQQSRKTKAMQQMMSSLAKGDEVITSGGIAGKVNKVEDNFVTLTVAQDVDIMVQKNAIASVLPKGTLR